MNNSEPQGVRCHLEWNGQHFKAIIPGSWMQEGWLSCGIKVGDRYGCSVKFAEELKALGRLTPITAEEGKHYGCLSSCILRGGKTCSW